MKLISATTMAEAWLQGCVHLRSQQRWTDTTLVLHIEEPARVRRQDRAVSDALDAFLVEHDSYSNHTVAETIFPGYEYRTKGVDGVYKTYPDEIFPRITRHPDVRWGTYAHRLLRRPRKDGSLFNPLEECIRKMRDKQPKRAAYELGLGFGFDLATYDDEDDHSLRLGGPCLSHLSFKFIDKRVHLTVLYRSHYYIQRAYGNLLGLARLLSFVAEQVEVSPGVLVCHSTMAVLDTKLWGKGEVAALLSRCEELAGSSAGPQATHVAMHERSP